MASSSRPIYCTEVAKALGFNNHKCSRNYFLLKKNRARHKLRPFDVRNPEQVEAIKKLMSVHPHINRSTRVPFEDRVCRIIGGYTFELCDNFRLKLLDAAPVSSAIEQGINTSSSTTTSQSDSSQRSAAQEVTATVATETTIANENTTLGTTESNNESDQFFIQPPSPSNIPPQPPRSPRQEEQEDPPPLQEQPSVDDSRKRRSKHMVLVDMINSLVLDKDVRKKPSELKDYHSIQIRAKRGLAYLIRLCGFSNIEKPDIIHEHEMMTELYLLLREIKAQATIAFKLTPPLLTDDDDYDLSNDEEEDTPASETTLNNPSSVENNQPITKNCTKLQSLLSEKMSTKNYDSARKELAEISDGTMTMKSKYMLTKPARELVVTYKVQNADYEKDLLEAERNPTTSLSTNLVRDNNTQSISFSKQLKTPEFLFGARLPIDTAINLLLDKINRIVTQIPNASLEDAMGTSMLLGCADGAEMDALPKNTKNVTTLCIVPASRFLVESCGVHTSSVDHILPINQLNGKEHIDHIKFILKERFNDWVNVKETERVQNFDITFQDMNDAKFTYMMLQCSAWSRKYRPFCACECERGEAFRTKECKRITNEKYREYKRKSEQRWAMRDIIRRTRRSNEYTEADHRDWVDQFNFGVSHFGVPPDNWDISSLVYDVFHGRGNYVKLQLRYARRLLEGNFDAVDKFSSFLLRLKGFQSFHVTPWLNNESNSRLKGEHTKTFTKNTHRACSLLKSLLRSEKCDVFCDALYTFEKVSCFLSFTLIDDFDAANVFLNSSEFTSNTPKDTIGNAMIIEFERLNSDLYNFGMKTFLSDRVHGDLETFYSHVLRWYLPDIIKRVYAKYKLGPGIFTMEAFEAMNFSTKNVLRNKCNHKGNVCAQTMIELVTQYTSHHHDVSKSLSAKDKQKEKNIEATQRIHHENESSSTSSSTVVAL